jgi:copper chaperone CopZ
VRSALASVKGVRRADVFLENHEASVEYDATQCGVETLIAAVVSVKVPGMPTSFSAAVKEAPR